MLAYILRLALGDFDRAMSASVGGWRKWTSAQCWPKRLLVSSFATHLEFGIGPARNLNNHVEDGLLLVGIERNVVERRDGNAILLNVDAVLQGVLGSNLANRVLGSHCGSGTSAGRRLTMGCRARQVTSYLGGPLGRYFEGGGRGGDGVMGRVFSLAK